MNMDSQKVVSFPASDATLSEIARVVDLYDLAVVALGSKPRYLVVELDETDRMPDVPDEELLAISRKLMKRNQTIYRELAK